MAKRIVTKIGDVFCTEIDGEFKSYFQYVANDMSQLNSSVIRVFKTHYPLDANPKIEQIVSDEIAFYAHTILRVGIHANAWYKVGKSAYIGEDALKQVIFGTTQDVIINSSKTISKVNPLENWYIWHINETPRLVGVLPEKYRNTVYIGTVIPFHSIDSKIKYGFYINTSPVFDVVKRIPHKDVDIYLKVINDNQTIYYQFKGQRAVKELTITNGVAIKLTVDNPKANGYELRKADFSETNWLYSNFITRQEFEDAWHAH